MDPFRTCQKVFLALDIEKCTNRSFSNGQMFYETNLKTHLYNTSLSTTKNLTSYLVRNMYGGINEMFEKITKDLQLFIQLKSFSSSNSI